MSASSGLGMAHASSRRACALRGTSGRAECGVPGLSLVPRCLGVRQAVCVTACPWLGEGLTRHWPYISRR